MMVGFLRMYLKDRATILASVSLLSLLSPPVLSLDIVYCQVQMYIYLLLYETDLLSRILAVLTLPARTQPGYSLLSGTNIHIFTIISNRLAVLVSLSVSLLSLLPPPVLRYTYGQVQLYRCIISQFGKLAVYFSYIFILTLPARTQSRYSNCQRILNNQSKKTFVLQ